MALSRFLVLTSAAAYLASQLSGVEGTTFLAPGQDIGLPSSDSASNPLEWLGANSPFFAGPNVNGIGNEVPEGCEVEQVAYAVRHGSRYPDSGSYTQWTILAAKIQAADFKATGVMAFLHDWEPVLTNLVAQMSQESPTGYKEAFDLGYQLRTRYPKLYAYGTPFISWANLYPRVVQTAQNFVRGFLGSTASSIGLVITVNSTGSEGALFDSLAPSDLCPNFVDASGGTEITSWNAIYLPPITARLNAMITGDLTFTTSDVSLFPYLCGFESQITGTLSPWCSTFTDAELEQYEYAQDLRYYFGIGPGVDLASKMMLPFINRFVGILNQGPGVNGTFANGTEFTLPNILTAFMNDGQITELGAATGVWDNTTPLSGTEIPAGYAYLASRFVSMRGTVAFERLNCAVSSSNSKRGEEQGGNPKVTIRLTTTVCPTPEPTEWTTSTILVTKTHTITSCAPTIERCSVGKVTETVFTSTTVCPVTATESGFASSSSGLERGSSGFTTLTSRTVSASSSEPGSGATTTSPGTSQTGSSTTILSPSGYTNSSLSTTPTGYINSTTTTTSPALPTSTSSSGNATYIRILLNDAVYPVPSCHDGPGKSCLMSTYVEFLAQRLEDAGNLKSRCNVTHDGAPDVLQGASFFTDLGDSWLATVAP